MVVLHLVGKGEVDVVALLLKLGADRTATTKDGNWTARKLAELEEEGKWGDAFWQRYL